MRPAGAGLGRQRLDAHAQHERSDVAPPHRDAFTTELVAQHSGAHEGMLQVQFIDPAHERQINWADRLGQVVHRAAAELEQLGLARDGKLVVTLDSIALRSAIPPW